MVTLFIIISSCQFLTLIYIRDQQQNPNLASVLTQEIASTEVTTLKTEVSNLKQVLQEKETQIKTLINTLNENSKNMTDLLTTFKQQIQQMTTRNAELESRLKLQQGTCTDTELSEGMQEIANCFGT